MRRMMTTHDMLAGLRGGQWNGVLGEEIRLSIERTADSELRLAIEQIAARPQEILTVGGVRGLGVVVTMLQWLSAMRAAGMKRDAYVLEPCAGSDPPVVMASCVHTRGRGRYVTVNLNRPLAALLRERTSHLEFELTIIEDDAANLPRHFGREKFDFVAFHHAVNDILQTAVAHDRGVDTTMIDWWPGQMDMIRHMVRYFESGRIEDVGRPELVRIASVAVEAVRPGCHVVFDHHTWKGHAAIADFPHGLFHELIPIARRWIHEAGLPVKEVHFEGFDDRWWMFLKKAGPCGCARQGRE